MEYEYKTFINCLYHKSQGTFYGERFLPWPLLRLTDLQKKANPLLPADWLCIFYDTKIQIIGRIWKLFPFENLS